MPTRYSPSTAVTAFLEQIGELPITRWLGIRDAVWTGDASAALAAYRRACDAATAAGMTGARRAAEDEVRRLTDAIAWAATFRPDGEAITRHDVGAMQILAEWAVAGLVVREQSGDVECATLLSPLDGLANSLS